MPAGGLQRLFACSPVARPAACAVLAGDVPKLLFTIEALDQPDPFAHDVGVPTSVRDAIWCTIYVFWCVGRWAIVVAVRWTSQRSDVDIIAWRENAIATIERCGSLLRYFVCDVFYYRLCRSLCCRSSGECDRWLAGSKKLAINATTRQ